MTLEEAKNDLEDFKGFCRYACNSCNNDWYCPSYCDVLEKASKMDFDRIIKSYARNDGDMAKVFKFIKLAKL